MNGSLSMGARPREDGSVEFRVWAPRARTVAVDIGATGDRVVAMRRENDETFAVVAADVAEGTDYLYVLDGETRRPDPFSRFQPHGVHGASRIVDPRSFAWTDHAWRGRKLEDAVLYEIHVGTFTAEGTFAGVIAKLPHLQRLGVSAIELMPVVEFPGARNWGYDGTYLYAPHSAYGGPAALKRLVDACHGAGIAVVLDVVYNHFGPEGNYLGDFARFASPTHRTRWGEAIDFHHIRGAGMRRFVIDNALYWLTEYHVDGLRLDAVHRIVDDHSHHVLRALTDELHAEAARLGRDVWLIAESDLNDVKVIEPAARGGWGFDAQWSDDFHHALHALLTESTRGYFADFGRVGDLAKALSDGFVLDGCRSIYRRRRHGTPSIASPGRQFVVYVQNHDQIANSSDGARLSELVSLAGQRLAAAILLCAPNVPMLFMGQEWGEIAPFLYFTSHGDPALADAVRRGRAEEHAAFARGGAPRDPQMPETFEQSRLRWSCLDEPVHTGLLRLHEDLVAIRRAHRCLSNCDKTRTRVRYDEEQRWLTLERADACGERALLACNFGARPQTVPLPDATGGAWRCVLRTDDSRYTGRGADDASSDSVIAALGAHLYVGDEPLP